MTSAPRVVVIGDLEATRLLCTLLAEDGSEAVHLLSPDEPALRAAFAEHVDGVAVIVRGDVAALRYALLAENLQPSVSMVVTVFDRTIADQLESVVPNCTVTSPADVAAPAVVAACIHPAALAVLVLHDGVLEGFYASTRLVATVGPADAQAHDAPGWYLVVSSLLMLLGIGFTGALVAGLVEWIVSARTAALVTTLDAPVARSDTSGGASQAAVEPVSSSLISAGLGTRPETTTFSSTTSPGVAITP